jgi:hypothetical protein
MERLFKTALVVFTLVLIFCPVALLAGLLYLAYLLSGVRP